MFGYRPPPESPMIDDTLTIAPRPAASIGRAAARAQRNTAVRLTSTTACQSWRVSSTDGRRKATPALFTRMSRRSRHAVMSVNAASIAASSVTSIVSER